jgi:uncharacterized protein YqgC (DUF456 family)
MIDPTYLSPAAVLAYILIILGVIGSVVPLLPGPLIIWAGALVWAWDNEFVRIGFPTLAFLLILALVAWTSDFLINTILSRRAGASWKSIFGSILGGILGGILLSGLIPVPILGSLIGATIGALLGAFAIEYLDKRDMNAALKAMKSYIGSVALASVVEIMVAMTMVFIFVWQAFL